ncbi:coiled-coil domain-containing protein 18 isoform X1 [Esox lucius]|uniref:Coiled-coil domain containing 18 n=2 Tax=Esox lucius TaxID=8010 RepID=A0A3P8YVF0_ESOLU|nr:coiled-coil domain-containing protein 18 isoform X1 [Esox lucius]
MFNSNDEDLVEDVASIRSQLRLTEITLQSLGEQLSHSEHDSPSERTDTSPGHGLPGRLTLGDLQQPDVTQPSPGNRSPERAISLAGTESRHSSSRSRGVEMEAVPLRKKLGGLRQENASLSMENRQLISDLEAAHVELASSKSKVRLLGNTFGTKASSVNVLREQILGLEAEVEAQAKDLRAAELKVELSQQAAAQSERQVSVLREELSMLRTQLTDTTRQGKRAEQQRNQALHNAEKLTDAFKDYKAKISIKLKKVMESESNLKESLIVCDREREELESRCCNLERERAEQGQNISKLMEELTQARTCNTKNVQLQARLEEAAQRASRLEMELGGRASASRDLASLRRETEDLRALVQCQEQRLAQCHREAQQSQAEMASLEGILGLLHLREGTEGSLCVRPCMLPTVDYTADLRPKPGERYQQLLPVLQAMEAERARQSSLATRLQDRLLKAQDEVSSLHSSMAQRASHYQQVHSELLEKASQANDAQKELKKKSARVSALEKQLQEKSSAYSQAALKNGQLEQDLLEKASSIQHYQSVMTKKQRDFQQALDKCRKDRSDQCRELQDRVEVLQLSLDQTQARVSELELERHEAQNTAVLLQASLDKLTQERENIVRHSEEALRDVKERAAESATKVRQLETALASCREELSSSLQQMEEAKERYQRQLDLKSQELSSLREELRSSSEMCRLSGQQCAQLQTSLQQLQSMLLESTTRVAELEDSQSQLQGQVSALEQDLERARSSLEEELSRREKELQDADMEVQEKRRQTAHLSGSVAQLSSEMSKCRGELLAMEQELQRLRREASIKSSQISQMEETLQKTQGLLEKKNNAVVDLEEKLHLCEQDRRNSVQRAAALEGQLQGVRGEMHDTLENLQELKDLLQRTQVTADERQVSLERLSAELRESQRELEERNHEVLDMDTALKERQGELQLRAQLLGQLDVAIRDHKLEMDKKVLSLQEALDRREREVRGRDEQVASLSERLDLLKAQLQMKEDLEKDALEQSQSLRACREQLQRTTEELQKLRGHCDNLSQELDSVTQHADQKEVQVRSLEEELSARGKHWVQGEARLQATISSLQQELEHEKEQHNKEVSCLQQTRGQLLKVSEQMSCSLRSSQEHLASRLQESQLQLEQARAQCARLQVQLHATQTSLQSTREALLIKESEVTRLQARISSLERTMELHHTSFHLLPDLGQPSSPPAHHGSPPDTRPRGHSRQKHTRSTPSPTRTPGKLMNHSPPPAPPPESRQPPQTHSPDCPTDTSSVDSSLDLPQSLKATLREALGQHLPWGSSLSSSPTPHHPDLSWQGLSRLEATSTSDLSFNPLTYMVEDKEGGEERDHPARESLLGWPTQEEVDTSSLTGMLRFVNQTLALQDDPSLWVSARLSEVERSLALKGDLKEGGGCSPGNI